MWKLIAIAIFLVVTLQISQCDITNLKEFLTLLESNPKTNYPIGFLSKTNGKVFKRYLRSNIDVQVYKHKEELFNAIDNGSIHAGFITSQTAQDLESKYHVFSSLIISPQAMLLAPDYNEKLTPYGLQNQSSNDLYDALNAAIADIQKDGVDETLLTQNNRTDLARVYTCQQEEQMKVVNKNDTTGFLREILWEKKKLLIGGIGRSDWGHDGNYQLNVSNGFYMLLLDKIVERLGKLKGSDGIIYSENIEYERRYFDNDTSLFQALLNGTIHATEVYLLIEAPYTGTNETCTDDTQCRPRESCVNGFCAHPARPRSLHFRTTCTTATRDTKLITKRTTPSNSTATGEQTSPQTPKTRWIAFLLLFVTLFASIFLILLIMVRRKSHYRLQQTMPGGFGKFARLQEEAEPPMEGMDAFDDHIVQSPRDNTNSTS